MLKLQTPLEPETPPHTEQADPRLAGLTIVLPCHNEQANVVEAVRQARDAARSVSLRHEIIVVDDGSSDATAEIAERLVRTSGDVRLVVHGSNRGYGAAVRAGVSAARMPWILLTDGDLQFDLADLRRFLPHTRDHDLLIGYREQRNDPVQRRINAAGWNWLVRRVFRLRVRDVDCAFKLLRRDLLDGFSLQSDGAMIDTELLVKSLRSGARMRQIGVRHRPRAAEEQSGAHPRVFARALRELAALRRTFGSTAAR
ncbi:MAG TPA: glycosyltransferase family 2 protein [Solirubrobacteraceae bacterium]|nr:glycosyltransferase family 2 protein [Solirubrobacteraceae bacterium]